MEEVIFNKIKNNKAELLLDIKLDAEVIDIHNDFNCTKVEIKDFSLIFHLVKSLPAKNFIPQTKFDYGCIEFKEFETENLNSLLMQKYPANIDNFGIGEAGNNINKSLFVIGFVGSEDFDIFAREAIVRFW